MPRQTLASTGFDVLCHATEVYTRDDCTPVVERFCKKAIHLVRDHLISSYAPHPQSSHEDRLCDAAGMAFADIYAGIALALKGTHLAHAISHPISGRFPEITHGQALAYVGPETARIQIKKGNSALRAKYEFLSDAIGGGQEFDQTMRNYRRLLGLECTAHAFTERDCESIFQDTMGYRLGSVKRCPAQLDEKDVRTIIDNSLLHKY
jgi:alcohol dehydrogenase class IV